MPNVPPVTTWTFLTVTLEALIVRSPGMYRPLSTVPFTVTITALVAVL